MFVTVRETVDGEPLFATADQRVVDAIIDALVEIIDSANARSRPANRAAPSVSPFLPEFRARQRTPPLTP